MKNQVIASIPTLTTKPSQADLIETAKDAFVYGFPLVVVDLTKEQFTNFATAQPAGAPINQFSNKQLFPGPSDTTVVRPNCDTFYSIAFLDLSNGPLVLSIPRTGKQYYMMPLLDGFTNVIPGSPGTRTGDTKGGNYLIRRPHHSIVSESDMEEFKAIIESPTDMIWALGRFQVDNPDLSDMTINGGGYVAHLQKKLTITPLSAWGSRPYTPPTGQTHNIRTANPNDIVSNMSITEFFTRLNRLLINNPPTNADFPAMKAFAKIGVGVNPEIPFGERRFPAATVTAMDRIPKLVVDSFTKAGSAPSSGKNGWSVNLNPSMGDYGTDYQMRGIIACIGLGANLVYDAVYFNTAQYQENAEEYELLDCSDNQQYQLVLNPVPPVSAFWSLTMYDETGALVSNSIQRYDVGHNATNPIVPVDNSVTLYIQNETIDATDPRFNNWLPAPQGKFNLLLRTYWPTQDGDEDGPILSGSWSPSAITKVQSS